MIITEIYDGQGLGNQLWCYVTTRVIAKDHGYTFGIMSPEKLKCNDFMNLDFGQKVIGGSGPEGGPPKTLPDGIQHYYREKKITHPLNGVDIRGYDPKLVSIPDNTKIDGIMQDEKYIAHRKHEIQEWLKVRPEFECNDYASDDICVINFRGGEYVGLTNVFLPQKYWDDALKHMRSVNPNFRFVVITDDVQTAQGFFPNFEVFHFSIAKDYVVLKNAHYLILSNSSFACFPAWLNQNLKLCIAPKYWSQYNTSDGFWGCNYNIIEGWKYLDRDGNLQPANECKAELLRYQQAHPDYYAQKRITSNFLVVSNYYNDISWVAEYTDNYLVYDQSATSIFPDNIDPSKIIKSPHLGHNIRDFCTYIIDHYEQLPDCVIFASGNVFPRFVPKEFFDRMMNNEYFTPIEDYQRHKVYWPTCFFSSDGGFCELNDDWYINSTHPRKYFHSYNDFIQFCFRNPILPRYIRFAPGANYVVPRANIRRLPKVFYENLRMFVSHDPRAIPSESHMIERALHTFWTAPFEISENMNQLLSSNFSGVPSSKKTIVPDLKSKLVKSIRGLLEKVYVALAK